MKCAKCGAEGSGNFCGECGATLREVEQPKFCTQCGTAVKGEERFCTECGASLEDQARAALAASAAAPTVAANTLAVAGAGVTTPPSSAAGKSAGSTAPPTSGKPAGSSGKKPLLKDNAFLMVVTAALLAFGAGLVIDQLGSGGEDAPMVTGPGGAAVGTPPGNPGAVDLNSMTPREAADRLFNRVVQAAENGDTAGAMQFLPMAIAAHDRAEPLDIDGLFHRSILERLEGATSAAIASAERMLEEHPTNLLALASAAEAASEAGDDAAAQAYYQRFLDAYDSEFGTSRPEYEQHGQMLPGMRAAALLATGS